MSFTFTNLPALHNTMNQNNDKRASFTFAYNGKQFSCLFIIDMTPFRLIAVPLGANFAFEILVNRDYTATPYIKEHFNDLMHFLGLKYDPNNKFNPEALFSIINQHIPANNYQKVGYSDTIRAERLCRDVEDADKIYFCGFRHNSANESVSDRNYEKTRIAFGDRIADMLRRENVSTRWTDIVGDENLNEINQYLAAH